MTGSRPSPSGEVVTSQIVRPRDPPIEVDWRLANQNGVYQIAVVIVGGVSIALTHRTEFGSMIQHSGGQLAGLLEAMRAQTTEGCGTSALLRRAADDSGAHQRLIADAMRLVGLSAKAPAPVGLVIGVVAFEPDHLAVALKS